ncbi:MAG: sulfatase-like hydrolase/transferase [Acidobacteriota bacterium]|nr:sulfatase-like hydrolase/transferase [Thermoanaerobaculaceae bacterium]
MAGKKKSILIYLAIMFFVIFSCSKGKEESGVNSTPVKNELSNIEEKPSFLLITIDTWRSDYIGVSKSGKVETPNIDYFAKNGIYIKKVETPCPLTTPAHASILTGLYPKNNGIRDNHHFKLRPEIKSIAELLKENGYKTIAVVSGSPLRSVYGLNQGFDFYDDEGLGVKGDESLTPSYRKGEISAERCFNLVEKEKKFPLFVWLHLYEPHKPYVPPSEYLKKYPNDPYAGEVSYADKIVGVLLRKTFEIKKGRWIVFITGDHGEGLGDNIEITHGLLLYKETRTVPLVVYDSENKFRSAGEGEKSLIDIAPTIADILKLKGQFDGTSISCSSQGRKLFSETLAPLTGFNVNGAFSVSFNNKIYIKNGISEEIYLDNNEKENRILSEKEFGGLAKKEIEEFFNENDIKENLILSNEDIKSLKSLGYIGGAGLPGKGAPIKCDLKDFVKEFNRLEFGRGFLQNGKFSEALPIYDDFLKKYPYSSELFTEKATIFFNLGRIGEAKEAIKKSLSIDPKNSVAYLNLGNIFIIEKDYKKAEESFLMCLKLEEEAEAYLNLGLLYYYYLNDKEKAKFYLNKFIENSPNDPERGKIEKLIKEN